MKGDYDEREEVRYSELYDELEAAAYDEHNAQFSPEYRKLHPWRPDGALIHAEVVRRMSDGN